MIGPIDHHLSDTRVSPEQHVRRDEPVRWIRKAKTVLVIGLDGSRRGTGRESEQQRRKDGDKARVSSHHLGQSTSSKTVSDGLALRSAPVVRGARRSGSGPALRYATHPTVELSPLPCWEDLSPDLQKKRIEEIAQEIEDESKARLEERGVPPLGPDAIRRQSPDTIPPRCALPGRKLSAGDAVRQRVIRFHPAVLSITAM